MEINAITGEFNPVKSKKIRANEQFVIKKNDDQEVLSLQKDAILSTLHVQTGESIGIFYDDFSTEEQPIMRAKVIDSQGKETEYRVNINDINPQNASYIEMIALSAHLKQQEKIDGPAGALATLTFNARVEQENSSTIYNKYNYSQQMNDMLQQTLKYGYMDTYARYMKELNIYLND